MFGLETFHIVFIVVLLAVALVVRFFMNRAMDEARKNGIVDNGLGFDMKGSGFTNDDYERSWVTDPSKSYLPGNIYHDDKAR